MYTFTPVVTTRQQQDYLNIYLEDMLFNGILVTIVTFSFIYWTHDGHQEKRKFGEIWILERIHIANMIEHSLENLLRRPSCRRPCCRSIAKDIISNMKRIRRTIQTHTQRKAFPLQVEAVAVDDVVVRKENRSTKRTNKTPPTNRRIGV